MSIFEEYGALKGEKYNLRKVSHAYQQIVNTHGYQGLSNLNGNS